MHAGWNCSYRLSNYIGDIVFLHRFPKLREEILTKVHIKAAVKKQWKRVDQKNCWDF